MLGLQSDARQGEERFASELTIHAFLRKGREKAHKITSCISLAACSAPAPVPPPWPGEAVSVQRVREQPEQHCSLRAGEPRAEGTPRLPGQRPLLPEAHPPAHKKGKQHGPGDGGRVQPRVRIVRRCHGDEAGPQSRGKAGPQDELWLKGWASTNRAQLRKGRGAPGWA